MTNKIPYRKGKIHGKVEFYDNGEVIKTVRYKKGKMKQQKEQTDQKKKAKTDQKKKKASK